MLHAEFWPFPPLHVESLGFVQPLCSRCFSADIFSLADDTFEDLSFFNNHFISFIKTSRLCAEKHSGIKEHWGRWFHTARSEGKKLLVHSKIEAARQVHHKIPCRKAFRQRKFEIILSEEFSSSSA